jgi:hypothetical protein
MLSQLRDAYETHVDVEFTVNFVDDRRYVINLVQCRPLQVQGAHITATPLPDLSEDQIIMRCSGGVVGHSRVHHIGRIIYVRPESYAALNEARKHEITRIIHAITNAPTRPEGGLLLLGPGRWGTSTPSLGVPVTFADIDPVTVLVEIDQIHDGLVADLSLGTHFFNELVERNILYLAYKELQEESFLDRAYLENAVNRLDEVLARRRDSHSDSIADPDAWREVVRVVDAPHAPWVLNANGQEQSAVLYREE